MTYQEQLKKPEWKKKRLEILIRDNATCYLCGYTGIKLNVHHISYIKGKKAWEYPDEMLFTVCRGCHKKIHRPELFDKWFTPKHISFHMTGVLSNI